MNLDKGTLTVTKSLSRVKGGRYELGPGKTKNAHRIVTIPQATVAAKRAHRAYTARVLLRRGIRSELVFANRDGGYLAHPNVGNRWNKDLEDAGLERRRLYDARHTHFTHLLEQGVDPKVASQRAGHVSVAITLDIYSHPSQEQDEIVAEKLQKALFGCEAGPLPAPSTPVVSLR